MDKSYYKNILRGIAIGLCCIVIGTSCKTEPTDINEGRGDDVNLTKEQIDENIRKMGEAYWNKATYTDTRENQIAKSITLLTSEQTALYSLLDRTYANVLVRDANAIMDGVCSNKHNDLKAMMKELEKFEHDDKAMTIQRKKQHDEQLRFSVSTYYRAKSWNEKYDASYDSEKLREAAAIRSTNPTCQKIKDKVNETAVRRLLDNRKEEYYSSIVSLYCQEPEWNATNHRRIRSFIKDSGNKSLLEAKLQKYREENEPKEITAY